MIFIDTFYQQIKTAEFVVNLEPLGSFVCNHLLMKIGLKGNGYVWSCLSELIYAYDA